MKVDTFIKDFLENAHTDFIGVNALGILRKDLVSVLGLERAKGFLLRFSYDCGVNDAKYFENNFTWDNEFQILETGYKINDFKGYAKFVPIDIRANRATGEFYFEGRWYYSYEADQHLQHFGFHDQPVCHTLSGYASGYSSQFLGEEVIFKEINCIAKGDPQCIFIGKTKREWGEEISDLLPLFQAENLSDELDRAYKRIEKQKRLLSDVMSINEKLSKILIKGGNIFTVLKVLSENFSSAVLLEDRNFNLIEASGSYMPYNMMELIDKYKRKSDADWVSQLLEKKRTVQFTVDRDVCGWKHERLISPVLLNNEVWGYISLLKQEGTFEEMERLLLDRANTICALHFSNERTAIETEKRIVGGFLNELLLPNPDTKNLSYRMKVMGYDLNKPHYINILDIHPNVNTVDTTNCKNQVIDYINYYFQSFEDNILISTLLDKIIFLVPDDLLKRIRSDSKSFGEQIVQLLFSKVKTKVSLGISSRFKGVENFQKSYAEATKAIEIAKRKEEDLNVITFAELGYVSFLLQSNNVDELESFAIKFLQAIMKYDEESNGELLKTLYYLLEFQGNITKTARKMIISEGAVRYRQKKIEELSAIDLTNSTDFVNAHLAMQVLILLGLWEI